jgi:hypothetical protein
MDELDLPEHQIDQLWVKIEKYGMARAKTAAANQMFIDGRGRPDVRAAEKEEDQARAELKKFIRFED